MVQYNWLDQHIYIYYIYFIYFSDLLENVTDPICDKSKFTICKHYFSSLP